MICIEIVIKPNLTHDYLRGVMSKRIHCFFWLETWPWPSHPWASSTKCLRVTIMVRNVTSGHFCVDTMVTLKFPNQKKQFINEKDEHLLLFLWILQKSHLKALNISGKVTTINQSDIAKHNIVLIVEKWDMGKFFPFENIFLFDFFKYFQCSLYEQMWSNWWLI